MVRFRHPVPGVKVRERDLGPHPVLETENDTLVLQTTTTWVELNLASWHPLHESILAPPQATRQPRLWLLYALGIYFLRTSPAYLYGQCCGSALDCHSLCPIPLPRAG